MKKHLLVATTIFTTATATVFGQDMMSKRGEPILPEAGDYSVGIDATPFLNYFGRLFSAAGANAPTWDFLNGQQTIIGKKMLDVNTAYRGIVRLGFTSNKTRAQIADVTQTTPPTYPTLPAMKEDIRKSSSNFIGLGVGMEKRRGKGRLQGIYGADAFLWTNGARTKYEYGNALSGSTPVVVTPGTTTDFGTNLTTDTYGNAARITESKIGRTFGIGVRGFVGVEFFVAPKISLGAEFGWGLGFAVTGDSKRTTESVGGAGPSVGTQEIASGKSSGIVLDVDRNAFQTSNGSLKINFYF